MDSENQELEMSYKRIMVECENWIRSDRVCKNLNMNYVDETAGNLDEDCN